jgi:hypothetical protein
MAWGQLPRLSVSITTGYGLKGGESGFDSRQNKTVSRHSCVQTGHPSSSSSSSLPIISCVGAKGFQEAFPATSVCCQPLHLPPCPSFSLCLFHNWPTPGLLWSASLPRALGVPIQCNPLNCIFVLPNSMPYPLPFSFTQPLSNRYSEFFHLGQSGRSATLTTHLSHAVPKAKD